MDNNLAVQTNGHHEKHDEVQILVVGVMRTGLQTLHEALRMMGNDRIFDQDRITVAYEHWDDVLQNRATKDTFHKMFSGFQVVMGMPTFCFWEQILDAYPNARVILTVRDEEEWWHSVERAFGQMGKDGQGSALTNGSLMQRFEQFLVPSYHKFCNLLRFAWASTLGAHALGGTALNEASTRASYRKHNAYVENMLGSKTMAGGEAKLLVYNVSEGWEPLCDFLKKEQPSCEFPSVRTVPFFPGSSPEELSQQNASMDLEERMVPDSEFGVRMRQELRKGLMYITVCLTIVAGLLFNIQWYLQAPVMFLCFAYMGIMLVVWNTYVVMHWAVMREPTLMVLPMAMKSMLIASSLHIIFIAYGILKESLVTRDHIASPVLVLASRLTSVLFGACWLLFSEGKLVFGAPLKDFVYFAVTNEASTWAGYEMLKYVSFPVQVMAKSCKMLPTMLMGSMMGVTEYAWHQYLQAVGALVCVAIMHFAEEPHNSKNGAAVLDDSFFGFSQGTRNACIGTLMLVIFFTCDSFTSQFQSALYKRHKGLTQTRMMLVGNMVGLVVTTFGLAFRWGPFVESLVRASQDPAILMRICALGVCGAMGQFCIYYAIKVLGPLSFTWIMTARQLLSVFISMIWFEHGVSVLKIGCILTVFTIMSSRQLAKVIPNARCCRPRQGKNGASKSE